MDKEDLIKKLEKAGLKDASELDIPLDKLTNNLWLDHPERSEDSLELTAKKCKDKIFLLYNLDFSGLPENVTFSRQLTVFDKNVCVASAALYNSGTDVFSISQLYHAMGYKGSPSSPIADAINESLKRLSGIQIEINNVMKVGKGKDRLEFYYRGPVMNCTRGAMSFNGSPVADAIKIFQEPVVIKLAREMKQITTVPIEVYQSPIKKTQFNLAVQDYLITRISYMKNVKRQSSDRILFNTTAIKCKANDARAKRTLKAVIRRFLDYWVEIEWIHEYAEDDDGITISVSPSKN